MDKEQAMAMMDRVTAAVKGYVERSLAPINQRLNAVEARTGVSINANSVSIPGMESVAEMMNKLDATMRAPSTPIYDERGKLIGVRRDIGADAGQGAYVALEARVKALEALLQRRDQQ
jgi:hypothetical protein